MLESMAMQFSEQELENEWKEGFMLLNKAGTGEVGPDELAIVTSALGQVHTPALLRAMVAHATGSSGKSFNLDDYSQMMTRRAMSSIALEQYAEELFIEFDQDNDGFVTGKELKAGMTRAGRDVADEEIDEMIREADLDTDGRLSKDEFCHVVIQALSMSD